MGGSPPQDTAAGVDAGNRSVLRLNNVVQVTCTVGWAMATPFIPLHLAALGASDAVVGAVLGGSGVLPLLVSVHAGALVEERGPVFLFKASIALYAMAAVLLVWIHSIAAVAVAWTLVGLGNIGFAVAPQAIVAAATTPATRIREYGYWFLWGSVGSVLGPALGGLVAARFGYLGAFACLGLLTVPCFAVAAMMHDISATEHPSASLATAHTLVGPVFRQPGVPGLLFTIFIIACGQQMQQAFYPLYLNSVGLSSTLIGVVVAATSLSSILVRSLLARGVASIGYLATLLAATALGAVALGITPLMKHLWPLMLVSGLIGASSGFTQPLSMSLMIESVSAEFWGMAIGLRQAVQRLATVTSPVVFGLVITRASIGAAFVAAAATVAATLPAMIGTTRPLRRVASTAASSLPEARDVGPQHGNV